MELRQFLHFCDRSGCGFFFDEIAFYAIVFVCRDFLSFHFGKDVPSLLFRQVCDAFAWAADDDGTVVCLPPSFGLFGNFFCRDGRKDFLDCLGIILYVDDGFIA